MPVALHINQTEDYVLRAEREAPADKQTVFVLGVMPGWKYRALQGRIGSRIPKSSLPVAGPNVPDSPEIAAARATEHAVLIEAFATLVPDIVQSGLRGWRNFRDAEGMEVTISVGMDGAPSLSSLARIDIDSLTELAERIMEINQPGAKLLGN